MRTTSASLARQGPEAIPAVYSGIHMYSYLRITYTPSIRCTAQRQGYFRRPKLSQPDKPCRRKLTASEASKDFTAQVNSNITSSLHGMPSFSSREYWDQRFQREKDPFDWLLPATALRDVASERVQGADLKAAQILHIGCGSSDSLALRDIVNSPSQIHNVDFSSFAIDAGRAREDDLQAKDAENQPLMEVEADGDNSLQQVGLPDSMRWSCVDLISLDSTFSLMEQQIEMGRMFDLILDKSTSDCIACGSDVRLRLPYPLSINGWTRGILASTVLQDADVHPLHVLAVHLAALTTPRTGRWIAISYSEDRFPFIPPYPRSVSHGFLPDSTIKAGFPHPGQLWRLESKEKIDPHAEETLAERRKRLKEGIVHRPHVPHWLYVLVRTDTIVTD